VNNQNKISKYRENSLFANSEAGTRIGRPVMYCPRTLLFTFLKNLKTQLMSYTRFQIRFQVKRASRCDKVAKRSKFKFKFREILQSPRAPSFDKSRQPPTVRQNYSPETRYCHGLFTTPASAIAPFQIPLVRLDQLVRLDNNFWKVHLR
jgi:hypothetical protein